jgi:hypothetical protein
MPMNCLTFFSLSVNTEHTPAEASQLDIYISTSAFTLPVDQQISTLEWETHLGTIILGVGRDRSGIPSLS